MSSKKTATPAELEIIADMAKQAEEYNDTFNKEIISLKNSLSRAKERGRAVQQKLNDEVDIDGNHAYDNENHQEDIDELIGEVRKAFRRNVNRMLEHQTRQLKSLLEKNCHEGDELKVATIEINALKRKLETKTGVIETLHSSIQKNEKLITKLEEKLCDEKENSKKAQQSSDSYKKELDEKKAELYERCVEVENLESILEKEKKSICSRVEERVQTLLKEVEEVKRKNASLIISAERTQSENDKLKTENIHLEKSNKELKSIITALNEENEEYSSKLGSLVSTEKERSDQAVDGLRQELIDLKEELSRHITTISQVQRERDITNDKYQSAMMKEQELRKELQVCNDKLESSEKKAKEQKEVYEQQEAQQMKLIDFLKEQNAQNEKKHKPFLSINSKIVGEDCSKRLKAEQDKNLRMNNELDELRKDYDKSLKEVRALKSQLMELHNIADHDENDENQALERRLKQIQDELMTENNLSPSKRKNSKSGKSGASKKTRPNDDMFSFSDACFKDILDD